MQPFHLHMPDKWERGVIFASPHSGRAYSDEFVAVSVLDAQTLRSSEDAFVDQLYSAAVALGAPLLRADAPRAFVDLNRDKADLDPAVIEGAHQAAPNARVHAGLGVVPRVVADGKAIYHGKLRISVAQARIEQFWVPYHRQLQQLLDQAYDRFGQAILIDCHSMPHAALSGDTGPHVVLGDRFGTTAAPDVTAGGERAFHSAGFRVARNVPFAGAYIAQHYGRPSAGVHVVQVELDRALYMDEASITPSDQFAMVQHRLRPVIRDLIAMGAQACIRAGGRLAAE